MSYDLTPGGKGPQGYPGGEYALAQSVHETPWWRSNPTLGAAGATLALIGGIIVGVSLPKATPEACEQALSYSEQGLTQAAKGMDSLGGAVGGGYGGMLKAEKELNSVTDELNRISPLYKEAKKECLG